MTEVALPPPVGVVDCCPGFWVRQMRGKLQMSDDHPGRDLKEQRLELQYSSHRQQPCASHPDWGVGMREAGLEQSSA